jgi:signal transduction histidine kinase
MPTTSDRTTLEDLQQLKAQLEHAQRLASIGSITSSVFHEVNNLLTPIISYAQLALAENPESELVQKALRKAILGAERAASIASCMLGFAHDRDGEPIVHLDHAVNDTLLCLGRDLSKDGIQLVREIPDDLWLRIQPVAIQQVLMNLLINARRAIDGKPGWIRVSAERSTWNRDEPQWGGADCALITFEDSGPGMPAELIAKAFVPFVRGVVDEHERRPGSGLGLPICRQLIEGADGTIELDPNASAGARFLIRLPMAHKPAGTPTARL